MDERTIDALARALAAGMPRRRIIGGIATGLTAALLGRRPEEVAAACANVGQQCDADEECCTGARCKDDVCVCKNNWTDCGDRCRKLASDENNCGACGVACRFGEECCDGDCLDVQSDPANCGACGVRCASDEICCRGRCGVKGRCGFCNTICPINRTCCAGDCVDLDVSHRNCGRCGRNCTSDERCANGTCVTFGSP
jgi:hypothetical protein